LRDRKNNNAFLLIVSLKGHYEKIALEIKGDKYLSQINISSCHHLRFDTKKTLSLGFFLLMLSYVAIKMFLTNRRLILAVPRSNSRAVNLPISLIFKYPFYTYSDGLGDCVHEFTLNKSSDYMGHIGSSKLFNNVVLEVPLEKYLESWKDLVFYDKSAPVLFIIKYPKEININYEKIDIFYREMIYKYQKNNQVLLSGRFKTDGNNYEFESFQIGPMIKLRKEIRVSSVVGFPSTVFLTFSKSIPENNINIITLPECGSDIKSYFKIKKMREVNINLMKLIRRLS
jgi:hypothetical protein